MRRPPTRRPSRPGAPLVAFGAFVAMALVIVLVSGTEPARAVRGGLAAALEPARAAVAGVAQAVVDVLSAVGEIGELRDENESLRQRLAAAEQRAAQLAEAASENAELRELLGITRALDMETLAARVTARDASNAVEEATLDVGAADGVRAGMPVVAGTDRAGALVGTVAEVTADTCVVRFIVDPRSVVIGVDQETRALGEVRGQAGGQLTLGNVPLTEPMAVGDTVVTAGLTVGDDASRYPGGLLLGRIEAVEADDNALTHTAYVRPAVDLREVTRVLVVLEFEQG